MIAATMMESSDCKAMHLQNAEQVVLVCSQGLKCPFPWEGRHLHAHYPCADIILVVSTAGSCFESIMTQGSGFVSSSFKQTCRMGNNWGNYQLPHSSRIVISFELQTHAGVVHTPGRAATMGTVSSARTGWKQWGVIVCCEEECPELGHGGSDGPSECLWTRRRWQSAMGSVVPVTHYGLLGKGENVSRTTPHNHRP